MIPPSDLLPGVCASVSSRRTSPLRMPVQHTFLATILYLSARSRFQQPAKYSNKVSFAGRDAMTVRTSGSSVMVAGESARRASRIVSVQSPVIFRGALRSKCATRQVTAALTASEGRTLVLVEELVLSFLEVREGPIGCLCLLPLHVPCQS